VTEKSILIRSSANEEMQRLSGRSYGGSSVKSCSPVGGCPGAKSQDRTLHDSARSVGATSCSVRSVVDELIVAYMERGLHCTFAAHSPLLGGPRADRIRRVQSGLAVRMDAARVASNPADTVGTFDRMAALEATRRWEQVIGVEQSVDDPLDYAPVEIYVLANVLMAMARSASDLIGPRLEELGHPSLISNVLVHHTGDSAMILGLLKHAPVAFDAEGKWLHRSAARLLLDAFESQYLEFVGEILAPSSDLEKTLRPKRTRN
jgi:hypothetical protein